MPTYTYECAGCEHTFDLFQGFSEAVKTKCPSCGAKKLKRLIGAGAAIIFKGSGFYQTDYRSSSYKEAAKKDSGEGTCSGTPSTCSKPECPSKSDT